MVVVLLMTIAYVASTASLGGFMAYPAVFAMANTDPAIAAIDRGCRLIKGQVFLWKPGQHWEDLWDVSGEITPA